MRFSILFWVTVAFVSSVTTVGAFSDEERAKLFERGKAQMSKGYRPPKGPPPVTIPPPSPETLMTVIILNHGFNCPKMISLSFSGQDEFGDVYLASCAVPNNALNYTLSIKPDGTNRVVFTGKLL